MERRGFRRFLFTGLLAAGLAAWPGIRAASEDAEGRWMAGDYHTHTLLSDGGCPLDEVAFHAFLYGLDWFAVTDHGGAFSRDRHGNRFPERVPRWITLENQSYPAVRSLREAFPQMEVLLGFEWTVPGLEHASVVIAADEPDAVSAFEYMCDAGDADTSRDLPKWNRTRADALKCAAYLEARYGGASFLLPNHPSRKMKYGIADLRDLNDAAPNVMFGFEGIPGAQKHAVRGGYDFVSPHRFDDGRSRTHGGADYMAAKVGGTWDALLGDGRRFFLFANSDFHEKGFRPGEYAKSYTFVKGAGPKAVVDGMRSGNSFAVLGDLIDALSFTASAGGGAAAMGEALRVTKGDRVEISVAFRSPEFNNNGDAPRVDHIDVIAGRVEGKAKPGTRAYKRDVNPTARVVARISAGNWTCDKGSCRAKIDAGAVHEAMYFRLRGTNLPPSTPGETDEEGNPLSDDEACGKDQAPPKCNTREKAYADLWFYSNPIFVDIMVP
ncbi:MAG: hypothetical protein H6Q79_2516 [Deltaproteobacteria bacterium]|nr:hypothetical protein [Deltaproteobacteria bacterium]